MEDSMLIATAADGTVRAFIADTRNTVETARKIHAATPVASAALGRTLTAALLLGGMLKGEKELVTIHIKGDGPLGGILCTADAKGSVKGYVYYPDTEVPEKAPGKLDVGRAVGRGTLEIRKDIGLKEPYAGSCELISGEIAEDITHYFAVSEQIPTAAGLGVLVDRDRTILRAGGFLLQLMPNASEETAAFLEDKIAKMPAVTKLLEKNKTPEEILTLLLGELAVTIHEKREVRFSCNCTRQRVERALISIGRKDLEEILREDKKAQLKCHFCNQEYAFSEEDLTKLLEEVSGGTVPGTA